VNGCARVTFLSIYKVVWPADADKIANLAQQPNCNANICGRFRCSENVEKHRSTLFQWHSSESIVHWLYSILLVSNLYSFSIFRV